MCKDKEKCECVTCDCKKSFDADAKLVRLLPINKRYKELIKLYGDVWKLSIIDSGIKGFDDREGLWLLVENTNKFSTYARWVHIEDVEIIK